VERKHDKELFSQQAQPRTLGHLRRPAQTLLHPGSTRSVLCPRRTWRVGTGHYPRQVYHRWLRDGVDMRYAHVWGQQQPRRCAGRAYEWRHWFAMKRYEQLTKKQLIEFIKTIRPKADAYDGVLRTLGIDKDIIGYVANWGRTTNLGFKTIRINNMSVHIRFCSCGRELTMGANIEAMWSGKKNHIIILYVLVDAKDQQL